MHPPLVSCAFGRPIWIVLLGVSLHLALAAAAAAVPTNDTCAGAEVVPSSGPFPYLTPVLDVTTATNAGDPPLPPPSTFFDPNVTHSVWYRFVPQTDGLYTLSVGADTATTILDTSMVMYRSTAGCGGVTTVYAYNEDSGLLRSAITTNLTAGHDYYIVVWVGPIETATNDLLLQLRVSNPIIPVNDTCTGAEVIPGVLPATGHLTAVADTTLATTSSQVVPSCAAADPDRIPSREVWYQFTPVSSGPYVFSTKVNETLTTVEDTLLAIYTSAAGCSGPFTQVEGACNDNDVSRAAFTQTLNSSTTYYIVLWDNSPEVIPGETSVQLKVTAGLAPVVTTLPVVAVASTGAVLRGSINASGLRSSFWFEWGLTSGLGSTSRVRSIFAGSTATVITNLAVQPPLPETLQPNVAYRFRFVATNDSGASRGEEQTFMWSDTPPRLETPAILAGSDVRLQFNGQPSQLYLIQSSTDLSRPEAWGNLGLGSNTSGNVFQYLHHQGALDTNRHYRIELP